MTPSEIGKARMRTGGKSGGGGPPARLSDLPLSTENPDSWIGTPAGRDVGPTDQRNDPDHCLGHFGLCCRQATFAAPTPPRPRKWLLRRQRPRCCVPANIATSQRPARAGAGPGGLVRQSPQRSIQLVGSLRFLDRGRALCVFVKRQAAADGVSAETLDRRLADRFDRWLPHVAFMVCGGLVVHRHVSFLAAERLAPAADALALGRVGKRA